MIVPNYMPDPLEVPGNVTQEVYSFRVTYIRRVTLLYMVTVGIVAVLANYEWPKAGLFSAAGTLAMALLALDLWRIASRRSRFESYLSSAMLPTVVALTGWTACEVARLGWPAWAPLTGVVAATIYTLVCGRDYSFVGCFFLALVTSSVAIAALTPRLGLGVPQAAVALIANAAFLFYMQYDLASLLSRRRRGEEWAAVVDLYRDVFNVFGWAVRCVRHWRKHRIWEIAR